MPYTPHTEQDVREMLRVVGVDSIDALFASLPAEVRVDALNMPPGLSEHDVLQVLGGLASLNTPQGDYASFLGGGVYDHLIPSAAEAITSRSEFLTAYTPYQPEVSQGTLQVIYEWQTFITRLTGLPVSNASMYDGATALVEGVLMALAKTRRSVAVVPETLNPRYRAVLDTHLAWNGMEVRTAGRAADGTTDPDALAAVLDDAVGCVVIQNPNYLGCLEKADALAAQAAASGALVVACVNPVSLSLLKTPGEYGAAVAVGEAQPFGVPPTWGGPLLGFLSCTDELKRQIPGRVVGRTQDARGREGYVLTLQTREQHIRREKAVSNICSNQGLAMLQATVYLEALGKGGLKAVAELCWNKAHYAAGLVAKIPGFAVADGEFFKEFVVKTPVPAASIVEKLERRGVIPGLALSRYYPDRTHELLVCVTEMNTREQIELLARSLEEASV